MTRRPWFGRCFQIVAASVFLASVGLSEQPGRKSIDGVYKGTLGRQEIVLEVGATVPVSTGLPSTYYVGSYFYRRYGVPINLFGEATDDGSIRLREFEGEEETGAQWRLRFQNKEASGVFCKCKVESMGPDDAILKIALTRVSKGFDLEKRNSDDLLDQAYDDLLLDFPLQTGPEILVSKDKGYEVQSDPRFQIGIPHLTRFPNASVMKKVNENLAHELAKERVWVSDCLGGAGRDGAYEEKITVTALTNIEFSIVKEQFYFCGEAYPKRDIDTFSYNMRTGKRFR